MPFLKRDAFRKIFALLVSVDVFTGIKVFWNGGSVTPPPKKGTAIVEANSTGSIYADFVFSLRNKRKGRGSMWAEGELDVRHIPTNVKSSVEPPAFSETSFNIL